jgi:hypothetical protein
MKYCKKCGSLLKQSEPYEVKEEYDEDTGEKILKGRVLFECPNKPHWWDLSHDFYEAIVELEEESTSTPSQA